MNTLNRDPLDAGQVRRSLSPAAQAKLAHLTLLQETDSTNTAVLRLPGERQHAHAVLADRQTGGRGRRQKSWHSPAGGNIYLSLGWWFKNSGYPLSTLPLVVAVAVCRALNRTGLEGHGIKWPNDILAGGKKLAGILVESESSGRGPVLAVIGTGLNVRMPEPEPAEPMTAIDRPWTDLASELAADGSVPGRNELAAWLLQELLEALEYFETAGFDSALRGAWQSLDLLQGRKIVVEQGQERISGRARGVDQNGGLLLETATSGIKAFHSGEVSVHHD